MTPFLGQYVEFHQVYKDKLPSLDVIREFFSTLNTSQLLQLLCKLNIAIWKSSHESKARVELQQSLIEMLFPNEDHKIIYDLLNSSAKEKTLAVVFHRHQILLAIKVVLLMPENKQGKTLGEDKTSIGKYLLAISEYLQPPQSPIIEGIPAYDFEYSRKAIARLHYFSHSSIFVHNISRALEMWINLPQTSRFQNLLQRNSVSIDLQTEFVHETGITIEEFITLGIANIHNLEILDVHTENPYDFMLLPDKLWSATHLAKEKQEKIAKLYSQNTEDFSPAYEASVEDMLRGRDIFESNFLPLVYRPILNLTPQISVVSDPAYLEEWIVSGVYWILLNRFTEDKRKANDLSKYFGLLHQEYVFQLLNNLCTKVFEIKEREGIKTCDFVGLVEKAEVIYLLFVESKKIGLTLPVLLSGSKEETLRDLSKIFDKTGFGQVYETIKLYEKNELEELSEIDRNKVLEIYPLLATDRFIAEESLNRNLYEKEFLNKVVAQARLLLPQHVARPMFFSSEELEILEAAKQNDHEFDFITFLQLRDSKLNDREDRGLGQVLYGILVLGLGEIVHNLDSVWNDLYLAGYGKYKNTRLKTIFDHFMENLKKLLFPKEVGDR